MEKTIYADVLFLINFIINYLLLFATSNIVSLPFSRIRLLLSAFLGALYAVFAYIPIFSFFMSAFFKLFFSGLMIVAAFGFSRFFKGYLTFLAASLVLAGVSFLISFIAPSAFLELGGGIYYIHLSLPALFISAVSSFLLLRIIFMRRGGSASKTLCTVTIKNLDKTTTLPTLLDTGNSLLDPQTNARVLISDFDSLKSILPENSAQILNENRGSPFSLALDKLPEFPSFRLVPYKTVGIPFSLLLAYRPEAVYIDGKLEKNALCAISEVPVSDGSGYVALI